MWSSRIMFRASGLSVRTDWSTSRTPSEPCWVNRLNSQSSRADWANCAQFPWFPLIIAAAQKKIRKMVFQTFTHKESRHQSDNQSMTANQSIKQSIQQNNHNRPTNINQSINQSDSQRIKESIDRSINQMDLLFADNYGKWDLPIKRYRSLEIISHKCESPSSEGSEFRNPLVANPLTLSIVSSTKVSTPSCWNKSCRLRNALKCNCLASWSVPSAGCSKYAIKSFRRSTISFRLNFGKFGEWPTNEMRRSFGWRSSASKPLLNRWKRYAHLRITRAERDSSCWARLNVSVSSMCPSSSSTAIFSSPFTPRLVTSLVWYESHLPLTACCTRNTVSPYLKKNKTWSKEFAENQSINQSINQSKHQSINQSIEPSINRSIDRLINRWINRWINQSTERRPYKYTKKNDQNSIDVLHCLWSHSLFFLFLFIQSKFLVVFTGLEEEHGLLHRGLVPWDKGHGGAAVLHTHIAS